jgi:hypothetical protein
MAYAAAEEIRALNHRSGSLEAFHGEDAGTAAAPGNVSDTVDGLATMLERLPQTLQQLSRALQQLEEQQQIRMDDGTETGEAVSHVLRQLLNTQEFVHMGSKALREAAGTMSHMGGHWDAADDGEEDGTHV